jgi:hypothetical protein
MKIKHHIIRKFHESRQAPLWKWAIIIFLVVAMPLFFSFVRVMQTEQVIEVGEGQGN